MKWLVLVGVLSVLGCEQPTVVGEGEGEGRGRIASGEGEGEGSSVDPCDGVLCGDNQECENGDCFCEQGFVLDSGSCVSFHQVYADCCECLAENLIAGDRCEQNTDCSNPADSCWCKDEGCSDGTDENSQCGSSDIGPNAHFNNAECICDQPSCETYTCGDKCLIGDVSQCVQALDNNAQIRVVDGPTCVSGLCAGSCFLLSSTP